MAGPRLQPPRLRATRTATVAALLSGSTLAVAFPPTTATADETTGTWSGTVEVLGNYYYETSTRVIAPEVSTQMVSPNGIDVRAHYLVDAITSASQATGVQVDRPFTETRHEVGLGTGAELDLGDVQLDLDFDARYSHEPDYRALAFMGRSALALADRATVLSLSLSYWHDRVGRVLRFADDAPGGGPGGEMDPWPGTIDGTRATLDLEQVLTPRLILGASYDFAHLSGFLSNPYRDFTVDGQPFDENHPDRRVRHALRGRLIGAAGPTTSVTLALSLYRDDWDIQAIEPELRLQQRLADLFLLRLRYAYYGQTAAFFDGDDGVYETRPRYGTNDPKMTAFREQEIGTEVTLRLPFLETTPWSATMSLAFDAVFRTNRFGDAVIAQARLRVPFE